MHVWLLVKLQVLILSVRTNLFVLCFFLNTLIVFTGIDDHSEVFSSCQRISSKWEALGAYLHIRRSTVERIKKDCPSNSSDCVLKLLDGWLRRDSHSQPLPSWRVLCGAMEELDLDLSRVLSAQHQCGCCICTG